jgi:hypothetical protein
MITSIAIHCNKVTGFEIIVQFFKGPRIKKHLWQLICTVFLYSKTFCLQIPSEDMSCNACYKNCGCVKWYSRCTFNNSYSAPYDTCLPPVYNNSPVRFSSLLVLLHFSMLCYLSLPSMFRWKYWITSGTFCYILVIINGIEMNGNSFPLICWSDTLLWTHHYTHYMTNVHWFNRTRTFASTNVGFEVLMVVTMMVIHLGCNAA